jgi:hypothetical protein
VRGPRNPYWASDAHRRAIEPMTLANMHEPGKWMSWRRNKRRACAIAHTFVSASANLMQPDHRGSDMETLMKASCISVAVVLTALTTAPALAGSATKTFYNPTYGGYPLDYCVFWSRACGMPSANRYCSNKGLEGAVKFVKRPSSPTKLQGSGQICQGPTCASFHSITCYEHGL